MWTETSGVIGVGYEGQTLESFVGSLRGWKIGVLVDVRLNPISRKPGLSKRRLAETLAEVGIDYLHLPELGNPRDNRSGFATIGDEMGDAAREAYLGVIDRSDARDALNRIAALSRDTHVAVMCFEQSELHCHRHEVLAVVRRLASELTPA